MVTMKEIATSPLLTILVGIGLAYIVAFSIVYLLKARKRANELGLSLSSYCVLSVVEHLKQAEALDVLSELRSLMNGGPPKDKKTLPEVTVADLTEGKQPPAGPPEGSEGILDNSNT